MKKNQTNRIMSLLGALSSFIAFFCLFAVAFTEEVISVRGNLFQVMFPSSSSGYAYVYPLIAGMVFIILAFFLSLMAIFMSEKVQKIFGVINGVLLIAAGILFLMTITFYLMANPNIDLSLTGETSLGAGPICVAIFSFLGAIFNLAMLFLGKNNEVTSGKTIKKA